MGRVWAIGMHHPIAFIFFSVQFQYLNLEIQNAGEQIQSINTLYAKLYGRDWGCYFICEATSGLALHQQLGKQIFKINRIKPFKSSNKLVKSSYLSRNWTDISIESVNHYQVRGKDPAEVCLECAAFRFEYDAIQFEN